MDCMQISIQGTAILSPISGNAVLLESLILTTIAILS